MPRSGCVFEEVCEVVGQTYVSYHVRVDCRLASE